MRILCFNIDEEFIKYGICNENYELIETHKTPSDDYKNPDALVEKLSEITSGYGNIDKTAISIMGWVNSKTGVVISPAIFGEDKEVPLKDLIEKKTNNLHVFHALRMEIFHNSPLYERHCTL